MRAFAVLAALVAAATIGAAGAGATDVSHGYTCTIGLPTPDNQGVYFTTTKDVTVITDNGAAVTHCTFTGTGYTPPASPFPFSCNIGPDSNQVPADITELHMTRNGTIVLTCVATP